MKYEAGEGVIVFLVKCSGRDERAKLTSKPVGCSLCICMLSNCSYFNRSNRVLQNLSALGMRCAGARSLVSEEGDYRHRIIDGEPFFFVFRA